MKEYDKLELSKWIWGESKVQSTQIGLYFGTFNPIHVGHLILSNYIAQVAQLDKVWMVVTPHNPHKKKSSLLADHHRLYMVKEATEDNDLLNASDIEFNLPQPNYTVDTLTYLKEKYPDKQFCLIMGEDNLRSLHKWKNYEQILNNHKILVYPRVHTLGEDESALAKDEVLHHDNLMRVEAPLMNISSSFIRKNIEEGRDMRYLLTPPVYKYLDEMGFYK